MRTLALIVAASIACGPTGAIAAAGSEADSATSLVRGAFGNTIVETYPDGRQARIWLKADGTYTGEGRKHDKSSGHWNVKDRQLCFHQSHPFAFGVSYCTPIPKVGLGEAWQAKAFTGEEIMVKVERGHVAPG